jgi:anti-sigma factor RsiW
MPLYHYVLCGADGRVVTTVSAEHRSDGAARVAAQLLPREGVHKIEIWRGDRRIKHPDDG